MARSKKTKNEPNAATLAAAWGRKLPAALADLLASPDLAALEKQKVTVRYAGEHLATLRFEDPAFADLSEWMEDVGLGDDIDWATDDRPEFVHGLPIAIIQSKNLERELLAIRVDKPNLPVVIFTEGSFFEVWASLDDLVGELRGTRKNPITALQERVAAATKVEDAGKVAEAAKLFESALEELEAAALKEGSEGRDIVCAAHHRAGYCRYTLGDLDAAEHHYQESAKRGGSAAAFNLVHMAVEDRKDFALAAERVEAYWKDYGFITDEFRLNTFHYRALARAMIGELDKAREALGQIEKQSFARDDFGKEVERLLTALTEAGTSRATDGGDAARTLRTEAEARLEAWRESRRPKENQSPREWWDALDEDTRIVLKTNLEDPRFYQVPYYPEYAQATDDDLAKILALESFRSFSVVRKQPGKLGSYRAMPTLAPLARLKALQSIDLEHANGPYSLEPLAGLTQLRVLKLPGVKVDDVTPLAGLGIEELVLKDTEVADLQPLAKLPKLRRLDIWRTPVTDLKQLAPCIELRELVAGNTQAKELPTLPELAKLEVADFGFSRFPRRDVNAFKKAHPRCKVEYSQAKG